MMTIVVHLCAWCGKLEPGRDAALGPASWSLNGDPIEAPEGWLCWKCGPYNVEFDSG